jgi:hypothetical protein
VGTQEQEAASAEIAGGGMDDGQREPRGYGGVDRIAAGAEDLNTGIGGEMVDADNHAMAGPDWLLVQIGNHVLRALLQWVLGDGGERAGESGADESGKDGETGPSSHGVVSGYRGWGKTITRVVPWCTIPQQKPQGGVQVIGIQIEGELCLKSQT